MWNPDQIAALWRRQMPTKDDVLSLRVFHPYTCPDRGDSRHREIGSDLGMLVPTKDGWLCPFCDYRQDWSHETGSAA